MDYSKFGQNPRLESQKLDEQLGFRVFETESILCSKYKSYNKSTSENAGKRNFGPTHAWIGLHPQILQTPYNEIASFLNKLKPFNPKKIVDFGAGYGRVAVVMEQLIPEAEFIGYEIVKERANEGNRVLNRLGLKNAKILCEDIVASSFEVPDADIYFIYDFSEPGDLKAFLNKLSSKMEVSRFLFIAKGNGLRSLIQNKFPEFGQVIGLSILIIGAYIQLTAI